MAYIGPGSSVNQALLWDGTKWGPGNIPPANGPGLGALSPSIPVGKCVQWSNCFGGSIGSVNMPGFSLSVVAGTNDVMTNTKTDTYLGYSWQGMITTTAAAGQNMMRRNNNTGSQAAFLGNTANIGGFYFRSRLGTSSSTAWQATNAYFLGLRNLTTQPAAGANPSTLLNMVGIGADASDANLSFMCNDGAGAATKTDLGASFAMANKVGFDYEMWAGSNSSTVFYRVVHMISGAVASGSVSSNTPTVNTVMEWQVYGTNGVTAVVGAFAHGGCYIEATI